MSQQSLELDVMAAGARLVPHPENWAASWWGKIARLGGVPNFSRDFWITIGRDICYPSSVTDPWAHPVTVRHEIVHVLQQASAWLPWWLTKYLLSQSFRWRMEREAYLVDVRAGASIPRIVLDLATAYRIGLDRGMMIQWFEDNA